jgi:hypothetical protein
MEIEAQHHDFFDDPARLFYILSGMFGIPRNGLQTYAGDSATMQITVASLLRWSTPVRTYGDFGGRKGALDAEAVWQAPEGEFPYAQFKLAEIEYNCTTFRWTPPPNEP